MLQLSETPNVRSVAISGGPALCCVEYSVQRLPLGRLAASPAYFATSTLPVVAITGP